MENRFGHIFSWAPLKFEKRPADGGIITSKAKQSRFAHPISFAA
jgi:hypothetical protein